MKIDMKVCTTLFFLFSNLFLIAGEKSPGVSLSNPNVILVVADDLGYYDLSVTGSQLYETPNIDQLAKSGMQFTNAYVSHPRCIPSRYSIQTGKYPARVQIPGGTEQMRLSEITIGEAFKEAGYSTFFAGKWHLGKDESLWPHHQGYDINKGGCKSGSPGSYFFPYHNVKREQTNEPYYGIEDGVKGEYITDRLTNETVCFIKDHKNKPFFAVLCHYAVHTPFQAKQDKIDKYRKKLATLNFTGPAYTQKDGVTKMFQDNAVYAAMVESLDESIGKLIRTLKEENLYSNTIIVFTSDHGGLSNRGTNSKRGLATSNLPLRAGKGHIYEGGIKVPFFISWPNLIGSETKSNQLTINTDIFPTLLELAGIPLRPQNHLDGMSMVPAIKGNESVERTFFWHSPVSRAPFTGDENCSAIRIGNYKYLNFYDLQKAEMYNLETDPYETKNIVNIEPDKAEILRKELEIWKQNVNAIHKKKDGKKN